MDKVNVAIVGATGAVGEAMLEILAERGFPVDTLSLLASERSAGGKLQFSGRSIRVENLDGFDFSDTHIALFSAGGSVSAKYAPIAAAQGCVVIDNTSHFRRDATVPLIVPEVNAHRIVDYKNTNIIANPNCSTIQMLLALKPIYDAVGISKINVATYQSVSGAGKKGLESLASETARLLNGLETESSFFPKQIAFNVIPQIGPYEENGYTNEEMKMVWETQKIFEDEDIQVNPSCVRVPVFYGHSEAVHIETKLPISVSEVRTLLSDFPGIELSDEDQGLGYATAVTDGTGSDSVYVGRIRQDISSKLGLNLWIVSDNVRKGAALNSVQIAEILIKHL